MARGTLMPDSAQTVTLAPVTLDDIERRLVAMCGEQPDNEPMLMVHRVGPKRWVASVKGVKRARMCDTPWVSHECATVGEAICDLLWPEVVHVDSTTKKIDTRTIRQGEL